MDGVLDEVAGECIDQFLFAIFVNDINYLQAQKWYSGELKGSGRR